MVINTLRFIHHAAFLLGVGVLVLALSCASGRPSVAEQFRRYAEASASHDLATLEALTAEDIVWELGPWTFEGKAKALGPNAYDAGAQTELTYRNVRVEGNVVTFELIETSEIIRAVGMTELRHYPRFELEDGLVKHKGPSGKRPAAAYSIVELNRRMAPLRKWIRETHPEAMSQLLDADGGFVFSRENGARMLRLTRDWLASGAPGHSEEQRVGF